MKKICIIKLNAVRDESGIHTDFDAFRKENTENLNEIYMIQDPFEVQIINGVNNFYFEKISNAAQLALNDLNNRDSQFFKLVYLPFTGGNDKKDNWVSFALQFVEKLFEAYLPTFYGDHGKVWAAYTFIGSGQIYFKFSAPEESVSTSLGRMDCRALNDYAMPFYYKEFSDWSSAYADHPDVKAWGSFTVSLD